VANSTDFVAVMAELHAALKPGDLAQTLGRVTDAAVELLPDVDGATITVEHQDGRFETVAATGSVDAGSESHAGPDPGLEESAAELPADTAARLDQLQQALNEGPAVDVVDPSASPDWFREGTEPEERGRGSIESLVHDLLADSDAGQPREPGQAPAVRSSDLSRDERYPAYGAVAEWEGVRAQVAVVLFDTARSRGLLNLYSLRSGAFDDTTALTDLFVRHSATALAYAAEYADRETTGAERRAIGQALGIVMERYRLSEAKAFALLQRTAERRAVSVRLVAQELMAGAEEAGSQE
jgi:hypothetical protein